MTSVNLVPKDMPRAFGYDTCASHLMCVFLLQICHITYNKSLAAGRSTHKHEVARHFSTSLEEHKVCILWYRAHQEHRAYEQPVMDEVVKDMSRAIGCDICASDLMCVFLLRIWHITYNKTLAAVRSTHKHEVARHGLTNLVEHKVCILWYRAHQEKRA